MEVVIRASMAYSEIAGTTIIQRIVDIVVKESSIKINKVGFILEKQDQSIEKVIVDIFLMDQNLWVLSNKH